MNKNPIEVKMDLLIGVIQDLKDEVKILTANQKPSHNWLSTKELGQSVGVTDKCILKWVYSGLLPETCYSKKSRGKYYVYKFDARKAIPIAENLITR
tara:strand:+ start:764 stop:1054 length:291 start_codon:yes stop_codon:yes gene_type:complete